jgi:hypothetical protein
MRTRYGTTLQLRHEWDQAEIEWQRTLTRHIEDIGDEAAIARRQQHKYHDKSRQAAKIEEGDLVVIKDVYRPAGVAGKLHRPYVGPWQVLKVKPNRTLQLADIEGHKLDREVPLDHVKVWRLEEDARGQH